MDGNIKDTPPVMLVPKPEDRPRWDAVKKELPEVQKQADARKAAARTDFDKWLTGAAAGEVAASVPTDGLRVFAPLNEGDGNATTVTADGKPRQVTLGRSSVGTRATSRPKRSEPNRASPSSLPTPATSTRTRASPTGRG